MAKNQTTFSIKGQLDISDITKGLEQIRSKIQSSDIGTGLTAGLMKDLSAIEKKFETAFKNLPGIGATSNQVEKFATKIYDATEDLNLLAQKMKDFGATDKYIKENIGSIQKFANSLTAATKKAQEAKEAVKNFQFQETSSDAQIKTIHKEKTGKMRVAANAGDTEALKREYDELISQIQSRITTSQEKNDTTREQALVQVLQQLQDEWKELLPLAEQVESSFCSQTKAQEEYKNAFEKAVTTVDTGAKDIAGDLDNLTTVTEKVGDQAVETAQDLKKVEEASKSFSDIQHRIKDIFSATSMFYSIRQVVRGAIQDFKELDKQFNEIAIVSDYTTKEMWASFSSVNKVAQEFGVETKNVLEVQNLYYHQGKNMAEVNKLTAQTLTLAKITGMDYERATSDLTAALNAYNIAAEDAVRVTDTIAAMDTNAAISSEELMTALTKTASIAANAGMSLESTEVFLTKMIETTREAPENLGTALKTIIARFGEVKQEIDGEEIELADINRVDTALKSIGISLLDTAGQIRDLDGVFMELSSKWDDLDRNTQRYIATIAAGSRQQSRFIAMMEDYDRTLELTEIAQNSAGLGARQLAKSQESIETSVNRLKSTWQEFYSSLITSGMIKGVLELANGVLSLVNSLNDISPFLGTIVAGLAIWAVKTQIVDKVVLKLGQSIGEGIGQSSIFETLILSNVAAMDEQTRATLLASGALDKYKDSLVQAGIAEKGVGNVNLTSKNVPDYANKLISKGFYDPEKRQYTETGTRWVNFNNNRKKPMGVDRFSGYNNTLNKLLGKEGASNFLKETSALKGAEGFFKKTGKGISGTFKTMGAGAKALGSTITSTLSTAVGSLGAMLSVLWPILTAVVAIGGALLVWKTFFKASLDDTKQVEKLSKAQEEYNKQLKQTNDLKEKAKKYSEFRDAEGNVRKNLTAEQLKEEQEIAKSLVEEYPSLLEKIDEEGNYHLKNAAAIQNEIDAKERLLEQSEKTYHQLRLESTKKGVYTDTSTQAGQAIKNIQDYAATFGTEKLNKNEDLKEIAKAVDTAVAGTFNKSGFYDIMEAYATGKKSSFDQKDFTDLFAGNIVTEANWEKLLSMVEDGLEGYGDIINENGEVNKDALKEALIQTGAYDNVAAENAAKAFVELNEQLGGLYAQLLQGAAHEQSEIYIQLAKMQVNKIDFDTEVGDTVKTAISEAAVRAAKGDMSEEEWIALGDKRDELVEQQVETWAPDLKELRKNQWAEIETLLKEENALGANINDLSDYLSGNIEEIKEVGEKNTKEGMRGALTEFWDILPPEIQKTMPDMAGLIANGEEAVIKMLFEGILGFIGDQDLKAGVQDVLSDYEKYVKQYEDPSKFLGRTDIETFFGNFSGDQFKRWLEISSGLQEEQQATYLSTIAKAYNQKSVNLDEKQRQELLNTLLKTNLTDVNSVMPNIKEFQNLGYSTQEVFELMIQAANGAENIIGQDVASIEKRVSSTVEKFKADIESMGALMEGTASSEQLSSYLTSVEDTYSRLGLTGEEVTSKLASLRGSIQATGQGFKISTGTADEYGNTLYDVAIAAINMEMSLLKSQYAIAKTNENFEEMLRLEIAMIKLESEGAMLDAKRKQTSNDSRVKDLQKVKEKADELVNSLKTLVQWLMEFDRFANLDNIIKGLDQDYKHLEYEIDFSTNTDVIKKDIEKQISNINTQIAVNQGALRAAEDEKAMRRDVIEKNYSGYVSFDANGKAIVDAKKMQQFQEEIAKADSARQPTLQAEADLINDSVEAYNKAEDAVDKYSTALEDNFSELEKVLKDNYQAIVDVEKKLIDVRQAAEDKELKAVKDKYDAIKEENNKYLDSVRDMIDEERRIRDRVDKEQDVKDKEKKLAMMKMDTSGVYASDIRALEKELEGDYRNLEDDAVDSAIDELEKTFNTQAELYDKEIEYMENSLEYKREMMTEYNQWAQEMMTSGSDNMLAYLKANDQEYVAASKAEQQLWEMEWKGTLARGEAAHQAMSEDLMTSVSNSLDSCKDSANGFEGAIQEYGKTAMATNGEIEGSIETLTSYYEGLATGVSGVTENVNSLKDAYINAANAATALKAAQDYIAIGEGPPDTDIDNVNNGSNSGSRGNGEEKEASFHFVTTSGEKYDPNKHLHKAVVQVPSNWNVTGETMINSNTGERMFKITKNNGTIVNWISESGLDSNGRPKWQWPLQKYARGGYVDYTGPAWVDGTKSHPEYMLNATQTQQFETLVAALSSMFTNGNTPISHSSQKLGDAIYNFHINVDQMASDYDVDQLISRIEEKMVKASQYRNVTLVKKQK